jgi:hypothetical protein
MSKHCDVCNNSYPENEPRCPHCAAAGEPFTAEVAAGAEPASDSTSAINLAALAAGESSVNGGSGHSGSSVRRRGGADGNLAPDAEEPPSSGHVDLGGSRRSGTDEGGSDSESSAVNLGGRTRRPARQPVPRTEAAGDQAGAEPVVEAAREEAAADETSRRTGSGGGRLLVGGALGVLVGVVVTLGLSLIGVELPAGWKLGGAPPAAASALRQQPLAQPPAPAPGTPAATEQTRESARIEPARAPADGGAEDLAAYVALQDYLVQQKLLVKGGDPLKAVESAVTQNAGLAGQLKSANRELAAEKDRLGQKEAELNKSLSAAKAEAETAKKQATDVEKKLAAAEEQRKAAEGQVKGLDDRLATAAAERAAAEKTLSAVAEKLAAANITIDRKDVVQGVERVVRAAREKPAAAELSGRQPAPPEEPDALEGAAKYADGLRAFFAGRYADAESAFTAAVRADREDARYYYFLGLSRLALAKRAEADFEAGARLERENRPRGGAINAALERIQGPARQALNQFRP